MMLLLDGHNLVFRAFSSVPRSITDPQGRAVNGTYGFVGTLLRLVRDRSPMYLAAAFDVPDVPTFRHRLFSDYQGQRGPLGGTDAENFAWQVEQARVVLERFELRAVSVPGYEADDVMGTLAVASEAANVPALIVSTDRDIQQLVTDRIHVLVPGKVSVEVGPAEVEERLKVRPERIVGWKALAGDPSDNIPGVAGIGDLTAKSLMSTYGSLDRVFAHLDELPTRQRSALAAGRERAALFADIVRIRTDLPIDTQIESYRLGYDRLPASAGDALREVGLRG